MNKKVDKYFKAKIEYDEKYSNFDPNKYRSNYALGLAKMDLAKSKNKLNKSIKSLDSATRKKLGVA